MLDGESYVDKNCMKIVSCQPYRFQKLIEEQHNARAGHHRSQAAEGGTLFGQHGHDEGTLQAVDAEHLRFRHGEPVLQGNRQLCPRHHPECAGTDKDGQQGEVHQPALLSDGTRKLVTETQQLVGNFVNIVNNARIPNPLKGEGTAEKKSDGYNCSTATNGCHWPTPSTPT